MIGFFIHLAIGEGFALGYAAGFALLDTATWWLGLMSPSAASSEVVPIWAPIAQNDLTSAVNTNWDLFQHEPTGTYFLRHNAGWLKTKDLNLLRARIGMVFQKPTPFPMSIYDNIAFGIRLYEKLGFEARGLRRGYYTDNREDALTMAVMLKRLTEIPALTVALVEGAAMGGGLDDAEYNARFKRYFGIELI